MAVTVKLKYLRISPRKARLVADMIRGRSVKQAEAQLDFTVKNAVEPFKKLLKSGVAAAINDFGLEEPNLYISEVRVDEGQTLKRGRARAKGAFYPIKKRASHIVLSLDQIEQEGSVSKKSVAKRSRRKTEISITGEQKEEKREIKEPFSEDRKRKRKRAIRQDSKGLLGGKRLRRGLNSQIEKFKRKSI